MKNIISTVSYGLLFSSITFAQAHSNEVHSVKKESAIKYLNEHHFVTKSYQKSSYNNQGIEISKVTGNSLSSWDLSSSNNELQLKFTSSNNRISTYIINNYEIDKNGSLHLSTQENNQHFWFHENYIIKEARDEEIELTENSLTHKLSWYYFK
jgi:hypothetical protein